MRKIGPKKKKENGQGTARDEVSGIECPQAPAIFSGRQGVFFGGAAPLTSEIEKGRCDGGVVVMSCCATECAALF